MLPHNGKALLFAQHHLEEITRQLELPALKSFFSSDPAALAAYLNEQGIASDPDVLPPRNGSIPGSLLPVVRQSLESLADPPIGLGQIERVTLDWRRWRKSWTPRIRRTCVFTSRRDCRIWEICRTAASNHQKVDSRRVKRELACGDQCRPQFQANGIVDSENGQRDSADSRSSDQKWPGPLKVIMPTVTTRVK